MVNAGSSWITFSERMVNDMTIVTKVREVQFESINVGEVFKCGGGVFMRIPRCTMNFTTTTEYNSVCMEDGKLYHTMDETLVTPLNAKLIVE